MLSSTANPVLFRWMVPGVDSYPARLRALDLQWLSHGREHADRHGVPHIVCSREASRSSRRTSRAETTVTSSTTGSCIFSRDFAASSRSSLIARRRNRVVSHLGATSRNGGHASFAHRRCAHARDLHGRVRAQRRRHGDADDLWRSRRNRALRMGRLGLHRDEHDHDPVLRTSRRPLRPEADPVRRAHAISSARRRAASRDR